MIFPFLWRLLPGPLWLRMMLAALAIVAIVAALATWVFPVIAELTTADDPDLR